jgi:hypothetical protein
MRDILRCIINAYEERIFYLSYALAERRSNLCAESRMKPSVSFGVSIEALGSLKPAEVLYDGTKHRRIQTTDRSRDGKNG